MFTMLNLERTDIINYFISKYDYKTYLEIGVLNPNINFNKITIDNKTGVDPNVVGVEYVMTSDVFFMQNKKMFDIIFIDGLHESEQVYRDIRNSLNVLNVGGTIIMHDCNPTKEIIQLVPQIQAGEWTGDCWKAFVKFRCETTNYNTFVINTDYGVGIIKESKKKLMPLIINETLTYSNLNKNRKKWLNLIDCENIEITLNKLEG